MEDLDRPRVVPGAADEILRVLERYGLEWDGEVAVQSTRLPLYGAALERLRSSRRVFDCSCSRADLQRAASAPAAGDPVDGEQRLYAGICRDGLREGAAARAVRFRVPGETIAFTDRVHGLVTENVAQRVGDFVVLRADGLYAYQLAVVVDDAKQGVTEIVRGGDLLSSTARQIALQRALSFATPEYAHLPLVLGPDGSKLGKRDGALPLVTLAERRVRRTLQLALQILGFPTAEATPGEMLQQAIEQFDWRQVPGRDWVLKSEE